MNEGESKIQKTKQMPPCTRETSYCFDFSVKNGPQTINIATFIYWSQIWAQFFVALVLANTNMAVDVE